MSLYDDIKKVYPDISDAEFAPNGSIVLMNNSDDKGDYIAKWEYSKPVPNGLSVGQQ